MIYNVVTMFCGLGAKTLGLLRSRSRAGSRFVSVGAFDVDAVACRDFELLTGAMAQVVDLGKIKDYELARHRVRGGARNVAAVRAVRRGQGGAADKAITRGAVASTSRPAESR